MVLPAYPSPSLPLVQQKVVADLVQQAFRTEKLSRKPASILSHNGNPAIRKPAGTPIPVYAVRGQKPHVWAINVNASTFPRFQETT